MARKDKQVQKISIKQSKRGTLESSEYRQLLHDITCKIRTSKYLAARAVNREALLLYFSIGGLISRKVRQKTWGTKVIQSLSLDIQKDIPGIRGFSERNLKNMRRFYEHFSATPFGQLLTAQMESPPIGQLTTAQMGMGSVISIAESFFAISFTSHMLLLQKCKSREEWMFYLQQASQNQWSVELLDHHIETKLYSQKGSMQNNFAATLRGPVRQDAIRAFRDEYLFPFIQVDDPNDEMLVEDAIVSNVKRFMMSLGREFAFMGNQYRLVVDEEDYFVDLLFYHRGLRAMIAIELKTGKFKPEFVGKMNFYLAALDQIVKLPDENPSIGIILCRNKKRTTVEYAFRFSTAPLGVATYKIAEKLPQKLAGYLPSAEKLKRVISMNEGAEK
jgi:predicted nuclease of restriction endonuclease-like (RecB) superfamily